MLKKIALSMFGSKERVRGQTLEELCAHLTGLGVDARLPARGQPEERLYQAYGRSFGIIHVQDGPIRWVDAYKQDDTYENGGGISLTIEYGVPDPRIAGYGPGWVSIATRYVRNFFGRIQGIHWTGKDFGLGVIDRLDNDASMSRLIRFRQAAGIVADPSRSCWTISVSMGQGDSRH